ncbi:MAG: autotransporter outer membrane beta-barrel domain-containing protein, partial [Novosphingobium sp.]
TGSIDGDGNAADVDRGDYGSELGIDYRAPGNAWALGVQVGWTFHGQLDVNGRASRANYDGWEVGGYSRYGTGRAGPTVSATLSYGEAKTDVTRAIAIGSLARTAQGHADYRTFSLAGEARYGLGQDGDGWAYGPLVSIDFASTDMGSVAETGAGALNLSGNGASHKLTRYGGGLFAGWQGARGAVDVSAQYVAGNTEYGEASFALDGAPGTLRPVRSPVVDADGALLAASGRIDLGGSWTLSAETRALIASGNSDLAGSVSLGWRF